MVPRIASICLSIMLLMAAFPLTSGTIHGKQVRESSDVQCADSATGATFQSATGASQATVCPSVVVFGHPLRVIVHTRRFTPVRLQVQYPDGTTALSPQRATDGQGQAILELVVRYNPINRYVEAPFLVLIGRGGRVDTISGTVTIAQGVPLSTTRLRVRQVGMGNEGTWCPSDPALCTVQNGSRIIIRVDTDPGAQVSVTLFYPDNQSVSCTSNDLTGSDFASDAGIYRCELPVVFQARGKRGSTLLVTAQVTSGSYSKTLPQKLRLVAS
jgi:hypothetical protein